MSEGRRPASVAFDARPLVDPVDRHAVRSFAQQLRAQARVGSSIGAATYVIGIVVAFFVVSVFGSVFFAVATSLFAMASRGAADTVFSLAATVIPLLVVGGAVTVIVLTLVRRWNGSRERWFRLDRFARSNGMSYLPQLADPALPGMIFSQGSSRMSSDLVRGDRPRFVEFANYRYTTGSGKNRTTHAWGYVAVKLDVPLPHIVLDAQSNNGLFGSNLPTTFDKDQRLSLEGDFDRHFALYCPAGYEADALYLFTPDIMARFIDNAAALDVEIVDDWLFLYAKRDFSTLDPATWAWLFGAVGALLDKLAQWARWRDDRLAASVAAVSAPAASVSAAPGALPFAAPAGLLRPPPGVAAPGRRLKRGVPWVAIIVMGVFAVLWLFPQILGFFGAFVGGFLR